MQCVNMSLSVLSLWGQNFRNLCTTPCFPTACVVCKITVQNALHTYLVQHLKHPLYIYGGSKRKKEKGVRSMDQVTYRRSALHTLVWQVVHIFFTFLLYVLILQSFFYPNDFEITVLDCIFSSWWMKKWKGDRQVFCLFFYPTTFLYTWKGPIMITFTNKYTSLWEFK